MTIDRMTGSVRFNCDNCRKDYRTNCMGMNDALRAAKIVGWIMVESGPDRGHYCSLNCRNGLFETSKDMKVKNAR